MTQYEGHSPFHGYYAGKDSRSALAGNVGHQVREQEILTPDWILEAARAALGGTIALDPCASVDPRNHFAAHNCSMGPEGQAVRAELTALAAYKAATDSEEAARKKRISELKIVYKNQHLLKGALEYDWDIGPTFVNPPFSVLAAWMEKARLAPVPVVLLCPARVSRSWWWKLAGDTYPGSDLVFLAPFAYKGYKSALPEPGALIGYRCKIPDLGKRETYRQKQLGV